MVVAASLVVTGGALDEHLSQDDGAQDQQETYLRVVHASPDAPAVDVLVEGDEVLGNVSFSAVSDYLTLSAGTYNVTITAADDPSVVVFDDAVTLEPRTATTLAASGEISEGAATSFAPVAFSDDALAPGTNSSAVRVVHLSPDAPTVDVTVTTDDGTLVLADNVSFRNASDYVTVPAGDYTVDIRAATAADNGTIVTSVDVSLSGGEVYTAMAAGYLDAAAAPADTPFQVLLTEDAQTTLTLPAEEMPGNATATETAMGNETEAPPATETENESAKGH